MKAKKSLGSPRACPNDSVWRGAKAKWGQNFLRDEKILKKIVDFARIEDTDTVVEIGPGEGTLTKFLLEKAACVIAIEKDRLLAEKLKAKFKNEIEEGKLKIIEGDVLMLPLEKVSKGVFEMTRSQKTPFDTFENYILVGNIPYYITGALFKKFLESKNQPSSITFVVQKEVAERIMARDGKESILSISVKAYGTPEYGGVIRAGSFSPAPKVDSAIIHIGNISKKRFEEITPPLLTGAVHSLDFSTKNLNEPCEPSKYSGSHPLTLRGEENKRKTEKRFFEIVKLGFAHKRKLLIKNLMSSHKDVSRPGLDTEKASKGAFKLPRSQKTPFDAFKKCGIPEKARAEDLKVEDWICLTRELM